MYPSDPRINEHHCASSLTSQLAVVFRGAALPVRRLQRGSLTTSVNQPDRGGGGGGVHTHWLCMNSRHCPGKHKSYSVMSPKVNRTQFSLPATKHNISPFPGITLVRPSNDEMGAVTLQLATGNPTLQQQWGEKPSIGIWWIYPQLLFWLRHRLESLNLACVCI